MIFWKIAFRNVKKNWRHSLSALLSLSASFLSLVLFEGYIVDLKMMYEDSYLHAQMFGHLIIEKPLFREKEGLADPGKYSIFESEQEKIEAFIQRHPDMVRTRVRFLDFKGMASNGIQSTILLGRGQDVEEGLKVRGDNWAWNTTFGVPLYQSKEESPVTLGQGLARKLGCSFSNKRDFDTLNGGYPPVDRPFECPTRDIQFSAMTDEGQLNAVDVTITGLFDVGYKDLDDRFSAVPLPMAQTLMNTKSVTMYSFELVDEKFVPEVIRLFRSEVESQIPEIKISTWKEHPVGESYLKTMGLLSIFRNFVIIIIFVISTLSVANTLIKIIKERSREIGTLRSIGFRSRQVLRMFVYETFLLSSFGAVIGAVAAIVLTIGLNALKIRYKAGMLSEPVSFVIRFSPSAYLVAFLILVVVSFIACLFSTRQALNRKIVDNLNHV